MIAFKSKTDVLLTPVTLTRWRFEPVDATWNIGSSAVFVELAPPVSSGCTVLVNGRFGACTTDCLTPAGTSNCGDDGLVALLLVASGVAPRVLPRDFLAVAGAVATGLDGTQPDASGAIPLEEQRDFLAVTGVVAAAFSDAVCFADEARGLRVGASPSLTILT